MKKRYLRDNDSIREPSYKEEIGMLQGRIPSDIFIRHIGVLSQRSLEIGSTQHRRSYTVQQQIRQFSKIAEFLSILYFL